MRFRGKLPGDREKVLARLDAAIESCKDEPPCYSYVQGECPNLTRCGGGIDGNYISEKIWDMDRKGDR